MDQLVSGEQDLEVDIEAGRSDATQESTSDIVSGNGGVWSERVNFGASEKVDDELYYPLMGNENPTKTSSQSLDLSERKRDIGKKFKKSRKASKPPRPPKGPSLTANDHKVMREIAELAMRKRARIERMKNSLRRIKAAKSSSSSSSSCISIFSMILTALFFGFLVFQGFFAGNLTMSSDKSPAPIVSPNNQLISVHFYNEFAPVEQTDPSPTTLYRRRLKRCHQMSFLCLVSINLFGLSFVLSCPLCMFCFVTVLNFRNCLFVEVRSCKRLRLNNDDDD